MLQWHLYLSPQFASQSIALSFDAVCLTHTVNTMFILTRFFFMCVGFGQASRLTVSQEKLGMDLMRTGNGLAWDDDQSRLARIEEIKKQLFDLVGLDKVKESMRTLLDLVEFSKMREKSGMHGFAAQSLHMRFLGNPGTGKTVVARLVGELLLAMGAITPVEGGNTSSGFVFKEASRADLVGEHTGATAIKVQGVVKEALGGVLFIDEAYALVQGARDNFGVEAVDTLIKEMEDNRAHLIVILAGYTKEMDDFFNSNPGFQSRVPFSFEFADYSCPELTQIGQLQLKSKSIALKGDGNCNEGSSCWWLRRTAQLSTRCCDEEDKSKCDMSKNDRSNGNGRTVRNILESSFRHMALRVLKGLSPEKLKEFFQALPNAPPMDCGSPEVSFDGYNGKDLRCDFSLLEGNDLVSSTLDLLNLNIAPCTTQITRDQVTRAAGDASRWTQLAELLAEVTDTKTGSKQKLEASCSKVYAFLDLFSGGSLMETTETDEEELEEILGEDIEEDQDDALIQMAETMQGDPLDRYEVMPKGGYCEEKKRRMSGDRPLTGMQLNDCADKCNKLRKGCTAFAHYDRECTIYHRGVPDGAVGRRTARCYRKASTAKASGAQPVKKVTTKKSGKSSVPFSGKTEKKKKNSGWNSQERRQLGGYGSRKEAQKAIQDNEIPEGINEKVDKLMEKLNRLVGLTKVKAGMAELRAMVEFDQWRRKLLPAAKSLMGQSFHMQFLGNPGTGKTVVARLVGKLLVEMGVIKKKEKDKDEAIFHEVSRADLVAEYKGQTAPKVLGAVSKAIGGVLFVDEAYSLKKEGKDSFGQEAVDTLIKEIEDKRDQVVAIFAGYEKEMETFFEANPGFKSRVPFKFYFDDYTCAELNHISGIFLEDKGFTASDEAKKWIDRTVRFSTSCCDDQGSDCEALRDSGNGRTVRNILEASYRNFAARVVPRLYNSKGMRPVLERIEWFRAQYEVAKETYKSKGAARYKKELEKDFGMAKCCSKEVTDYGATWYDLCEQAKNSLKVLQGEDVALVAASMASDNLLNDCREAKKDLKELHELSASAFKVLDDQLWEEVSQHATSGNCEGTFEALKKVPNPPPAPIYDNLQLMEESEELRPLLEKLRKLVGLKIVKEAMGQLFGLVKVSTWRQQLGMSSLGGQSFHMRFLGNPGTGKTVVARIVGEMMVKMGVVAMPKEVKKRLKEEAKMQGTREGVDHKEVELPLIFKEAARVDMVAQYLGQTAPKVEKAVGEALGGVLFIDEAYALVRDGKDSFGQEAVDTLIKEMEDKRKNVIVILAGYETEMDSFFDSNPGFKSRVPFTFRFEVLDSQGLVVADQASQRLEDLIAFTSGCCNNVADADCHPSRENGNGRTVRNVIEALQRAMARRVVQSKATDKESLRTLTLADLTLVAEEQAASRLEGPCGQTGLVTTLSQAAQTKGGLAVWNQQYQLSKPRVQLYRMIRESQRLSKSLKGFESAQLNGLSQQCTTGLDTLVKKLQSKIHATCDQILPKLTNELDDTAKLTVQEFEAMVRPLQMSSREAVHILELFASDDVPSPLNELQEAAMQCEDRLDTLRGQSVLAPLEMAVQALTIY
ncbi:unnamed protein product [Durusdinium trenchii]|uniref:AAA+ ATPase domain-containing protein n=2 Tax=Durusdinium trenchii TaxID=1381693 RepID=A0ABP0ITD8_9DINO